AGAISFQHVERPGGSQTLQDALVDGMRVDPSGKIGKTGKRALAARGDDRLDGLATDAFECGERVVDGVAFHLEGYARAVDRGRLDLHAEAHGFGAEF